MKDILQLIACILLVLVIGIFAIFVFYSIGYGTFYCIDKTLPPYLSISEQIFPLACIGVWPIMVICIVALFGMVVYELKEKIFDK